VRDVREVIDALGYGPKEDGKEGRGCVLVGHDWGGTVAWAAAHVLGPSMIKGLCVMNCPHPKGSMEQATVAQFFKSWYFYCAYGRGGEGGREGRGGVFVSLVLHFPCSLPIVSMIENGSPLYMHTHLITCISLPTPSSHLPPSLPPPPPPLSSLPSPHPPRDHAQRQPMVRDRGFFSRKTLWGPARGCRYVRNRPSCHEACLLPTRGGARSGELL
jgi:pimeloyl-ACP methyl ester carboxylesterase